MGLTHDEINFVFLVTLFFGGLALMILGHLFLKGSITLYVGLGMFVGALVIGVMESLKRGRT